MTPEQREELVRSLKKGEELSPEWSRILFPPEKREEDILADTLAVPLQPARTSGDNLQAMKTLLELKKAGKLCNAE